jgi:hypothetical protein
MVQVKYINLVKQQIASGNFKKGVKFFIFGSSLRKKRFGDLDIGVIGNIRKQEIHQLKEKFEESNLPYTVDIIDFNKAEKSFTDNVLNNKILWIKH